MLIYDPSLLLNPVVSVLEVSESARSIKFWKKHKKHKKARLEVRTMEQFESVKKMLVISKTTYKL
jgi:hypothetical protein